MPLDLIGLIHDTRNLCTLSFLKEAMSRGISGGDQKVKKSRSTLFILSKRNEDLMVMENVRFEFRQN